MQKTTLVGNNIRKEEVTRQVARLGCAAESMPFSYLGFPLGGSFRVIGFWKLLLYVLEQC